MTPLDKQMFNSLRDGSININHSTKGFCRSAKTGLLRPQQWQWVILKNSILDESGYLSQYTKSTMLKNCSLLISCISVKIKIIFLWLIVVCIQNGHHGCLDDLANDANDVADTQVG
jgi:hypothetical protein